MYLYERLKAVRKSCHRRQEEIARLLGITRQQYQLYECGKREMPMHHFLALARLYNISLDYLAGLTDTPRSLESA